MTIALACRAAMLSVLLLASAAAQPERSRFDLGLRGLMSAADGEPANDIPGIGVLGHWVMNDRWTLGAAVDRTEYDFEESAATVGIVQDPALEPIDAVAEATVVSAWIERTYASPQRPTTWFLGAGVGAASVDVPDVSGPRADGGRFDVENQRRHRAHRVGARGGAAVDR